MSPAPYLEAFRRRNNMTYLQLAHHIDYDPGNLCRLIHKKTYELRASTAYKIAKRLGITMEELLGVAEDKTRAVAPQSP